MKRERLREQKRVGRIVLEELHDLVERRAPYHEMAQKLEEIKFLYNHRLIFDLLYYPIEREWKGAPISHLRWIYERNALGMAGLIEEFVAKNPGAKLPITIGGTPFNDPYMDLLAVLHGVQANKWRPKELWFTKWINKWTVKKVREFLLSWTPDTFGNFPLIVQNEARRLLDTGAAESEIPAKLVEWMGL